MRQIGALTAFAIGLIWFTAASAWTFSQGSDVLTGTNTASVGQDVGTFGIGFSCSEDRGVQIWLRTRDSYRADVSATTTVSVTFDGGTINTLHLHSSNVEGRLWYVTRDEPSATNFAYGVRSLKQMMEVAAFNSTYKVAAGNVAADATKALKRCGLI